MNANEHRLQCACVKWFALQYPEYKGLLFAVPNGGNRDKVTGAMMKAEGVTAGVADLILLKPTKFKAGEWNGITLEGIFPALLIEMKTEKGRQSPAQKEWQKKVEAQGYKYIVVRSLDQFIQEINSYLCTA